MLLLAAVLTALAVEMVLPFLTYVLIAVLLAFVLRPLHLKLAPRVGPAISAALLIVGALVALIIPFLIMIAAVAGDAIRLAEQIQGSDVGLGTVESAIQEYTGREIDIAKRASGSVQGLGEQLAGQAPEAFGIVTHAFVGIGLALFLLFFLLKDGDKLLGWIRTITPLPEGVQDDLYESVGDITWAVLLGHVVVAAVQGAVAGIALFVVGIPNALFWTFLMMLLALIPAIGTPLVWGPAAVYLVWSGQTLAGAALFVYGAVVVNLTDEFLRPIVVDRRAKINPSIIIVGVIGGMYLMGFIGLFYGPIILGALKVTLEVIEEHYPELGSA